MDFHKILYCALLLNIFEKNPIGENQTKKYLEVNVKT